MAENDALAWRLATLERGMDEMQKRVEENIETKVILNELVKRVNRLTLSLWTIGGLVLSALSILLVLLKGG